jgi:hypothetical protein
VCPATDLLPLLCRPIFCRSATHQMPFPTLKCYVLSSNTIFATRYWLTTTWVPTTGLLATWPTFSHYHMPFTICWLFSPHILLSAFAACYPFCHHAVSSNAICYPQVLSGLFRCQRITACALLSALGHLPAILLCIKGHLPAAVGYSPCISCY